MTKLKTVEEVARPFMGMELDSYDVYSAMRADRANTLAVLEVAFKKDWDKSIDEGTVWDLGNVIEILQETLGE